MPGTPLAGKTIAVTRPLGQAGRLSSTLESLGARVIVSPALEIEALAADPGELERCTRQADLVVAVSANAVRSASEQVDLSASTAGFIAVGPATADALRDAGVVAVDTPEGGADSEHLLAMDPLNAVSGRRVVLLAGEGGRELLETTLRERGAVVERLALYRRRPAEPTPDLREALKTGRVDLVTVGSSASWDALIVGLGADASSLERSQVVVPSERVLQHITSRATLSRAPLVSGSALDEDLVDRILAAAL